MVADLRVMEIRQWTEKGQDREQWRLVVKEAVAPGGWIDGINKYCATAHTNWRTKFAKIFYSHTTCYF